MKTKNKKTLPTLSTLKTEADQIFSKWIRKRDKGRCYTCGTVKPESEMQNGHYISRSHLATRYDEENCHCQCVGCNVFKNGNMPIYSIRLQEEYGQDILLELYHKSREIITSPRKRYEEIIEKYNSLINK